MSKSVSTKLAKGTLGRANRTTPLTLLEEHYTHVEARLLANDGKLMPLSRSKLPSLKLLGCVRRRAHSTREA
jgi:hypothetical protein